MNTTPPPTLALEVPAFVALRREIHDALLAQNPEWILPNGDCPTCDSYDARFAELLIQSPPAAPRGPQGGNIHQSQFQFQYSPRVNATHHIQ